LPHPYLKVALSTIASFISQTIASIPDHYTYLAVFCIHLQPCLKEVLVSKGFGSLLRPDCLN